MDEYEENPEYEANEEGSSSEKSPSEKVSKANDDPTSQWDLPLLDEEKYILQSDDEEDSPISKKPLPSPNEGLEQRG